jgi:hypothetical protein
MANKKTRKQLFKGTEKRITQLRDSAANKQREQKRKEFFNAIISGDRPKD